MPARHASRRGPGERLVVIGALLFLAGAGVVAAVFVPFLFGRDERGVPLSLATFLTVAGLGLALLGLFRQARAAATAGPPPQPPGTPATPGPRPAPPPDRAPRR